MVHGHILADLTSDAGVLPDQEPVSSDEPATVAAADRTFNL
jgi:hypothetical protein